MSDRIYYSKEAEDRASQEKMTLMIIFLAFGLGIGAALALLFAPSSGDKTRDSIGGTLGDGLGAAGETAAGALKRLGQEVAELRKRVEDRF